MTEGTTNPPGRYTEGTLIDQMDKKGLGTVATRADIIEKLFHSFLLEKKGNGYSLCKTPVAWHFCNMQKTES